jgi:hypothetical protein
MELSEFDFELPPELIAQHPLEERDASRMLVIDRASDTLQDSRFHDFPEMLRGDELIVLNNARVLPARLFGRRVGIRSEKPGRDSAARDEHLTTSIEVLLVRELEPDLWETLVRREERSRSESASFSATASWKGRWKAGAGMACGLCDSLRERVFMKRLPDSATSRCRHTSSARMNHWIGSGTRRFMRDREARWPRRLQGFTSRLKF